MPEDLRRFVTEADDESRRIFGLSPSYTLSEAISKAKEINSTQQAEAMLIGEKLVVRRLLID